MSRQNIWKFNCRLPPGFQVSQPKLTLLSFRVSLSVQWVTQLNWSWTGSTYGGNHFLIGYQTQPLESKQQTQGPSFVHAPPLLLWRQVCIPSRRVQGELPPPTQGRQRLGCQLPPGMHPLSPSPLSLSESSRGCPARKGEGRPQPPEDIPSIRSLNSVQFSHSVMSNSLQPHGLQHTRPPCLSPTPGACSKLMPIESVMPSNQPAVCKLRMKRNWNRLFTHSHPEMWRQVSWMNTGLGIPRLTFCVLLLSDTGRKP